MTDNISTDIPTSPQGLSLSSLPQLEWSKKLAKLSAKRSSDLLSFSAKRLHAQAEFFQGLAHSDDLSDLFKRQSDFIQASWDAYSKELPKALGITGKGAD